MAAYDGLPPGERKLADTILSKLGSLASYSATELAAEATVSKATAARFFRRVGYRSFGHVRRQARAEAHLASPLYALAGVDSKERATDVLSRHVAADIRNLSETFDLPNAKPLAETAALLAKARHVRVIGVRNGHFVAAYGAHLLAQLRDGVTLLPGPAMTLAEDVALLAKGDAVLVVDFRRRSTLLPSLITAARGAGATLVFVSNPGMPPLARKDERVLHCLADGPSIFASCVAGMSLINFLCAAVAKELGKHSRRRLETIEAMHTSLADIALD